jgi:hypothetical protein
MDQFKRDLVEVTFDQLTESQHTVLDRAHKLFHLKHSGPLPFATQVAIAVLVDHMDRSKSRPKPKEVAK